MTAAALGILAGYSVLRLLRADHAWPWRVLDLAVDGEARPVRRARVRSASRPVRRARVRSAAQREWDLERDLPATIDLLRLAIGAGHTVHGAVTLVGAEAPGPAGRALRDVAEAFGRGGRLSEQLHALPARRGEALRPLCTVLVAALVSGEPPGPELARLADSERRRLRRRSEERVRRLPVLLLAPLVGLVLPAFVLLTVVPVALTTARSASLSGLSPGAAPSAAFELPPGTATTSRNPP